MHTQTRNGKYATYADKILFFLYNLPDKNFNHENPNIDIFTIEIPTRSHLSKILKIPRTSFNDVVSELIIGKLVTNIPYTLDEICTMYSHLYAKNRIHVNNHGRGNKIYLTDKGANYASNLIDSTNPK